MLKKPNELTINGRRFISSKQASALAGYTHDYIGQICRAGKIPGRLVGRTRFVDEEALLAYARKACLPIDEIENHGKETDHNLSVESVVTRPLHKSDFSSLSDAWGEIEYAEETDSRLKQTPTYDSLPTRQACLPTRQAHGSKYLRGIGVSIVGIVLIASGGYVFAMKLPVIAETLADVMYPLTDLSADEAGKTSFLSASFSYENNHLVAELLSGNENQGLTSAAITPTTTVNEEPPPVSNLGIGFPSKFDRESTLDRAALFTYYSINGFFSQTQSVLVEGLTRPLAPEKDSKEDKGETSPATEDSPSFSSYTDTLKETAQKIIPSSTITFDTQENDKKDTNEVTFIQTSTPAERQTTITRTIIQTPVINILGVSEDVMEDRLNQLNNKLLSLIANVSSQSTSQSQNVFKAVSLSQKIDKLSNITVSGVSGLTDSDIPNDITASNYLPLSGGTLTGTLAITGAGTSTISNNLLVSGGLEVGGTCINCGSGGGFSGTDLTVSGNTILGDATSTDTIAINARFTGSLIPSVHNALDIGDGANWLAWRTGYFGTSIGIGGTATSSATSLLSSGSYTIDTGGTPASSADKLYLNTTNNQPITTGSGLTTLSGGASTTILSVTNTAYFGGSATTTIDQAGNVTIPGSLSLSSIGKDMLVSINSSGNLTATSTPTASHYLATSTTASVFPYASTTAITSTGSASTTDLIVSGTATLGAFSQNSLLFAGAGGLISEDNANLSYNDTDNRLTATYASSTSLSASANISAQTLTITASTTFNGIEYLFPGADGSANQVLATNSAGGLSWTTVIGNPYNWQKETNYNSTVLTPTTTIPVWFKDAIYASSTLIVQGDTTLANLTATNATTTNATTTSLSVAQTASTTNLIVSNGATTTALYASGLSQLTNLTATNATTTSLQVAQTASTTNLIVSDTLTAHGILTVSGLTTLGNASTSILSVTNTASTTDLIVSRTLSVGASTTFNGVEYLFPSADGDANQILTTNSAGGLSWTTLASGLFTDGGTTSYLTAQNDNLGIGTTTSFAKLSIHALANDADTSQPLFAVASSTASATTTHFIITNTGNVGIGTTSPYTTLAVEGDIFSNNIHLANLSTSSFSVVRNASSSSLAVNGTLQHSSSSLYFTANNYRHNLTKRISATRASSSVASTSAYAGWVGRSATEASTWRGIIWSPELQLFAAVNNDGTNRVMTSPDGITWTARSAASADTWQGLAWSPELGLFAAVSSGVGGTNDIMTSPDGITWTGRTSPADKGWINIVWSPELGIFAVVAQSGTDNRVMTSPDGINWTLRTTPADNNWVDITWSPELGIFAAVAVTGTGDRIMTSSDGITWTLRNNPSDIEWYGMDWSPELGIFVAVGRTGTGNRVMTSPDGINWTLRTTPADNNWQEVAWSPELGLFAAVASSGTGNRIMTSPDGINWTLRDNPYDTTENNWYRIAWSPELGIFAATGNGGATYRVMTSRLFSSSNASAGLDLAESYPTKDTTLSKGDIVSFSSTDSVFINKASSTTTPIGVVSTEPGYYLGALSNSFAGNIRHPVALSGRVPVKVNLEGGDIAIGDRIAVSSIDGIGKKATSSVRTIGTALEPYTSESTGNTILVFMQNELTLKDSQFFIDPDTGNIGIGGFDGLTASTTPSYKLHVLGDVAATAFINLSTEEAKKDISHLTERDETTILEKLSSLQPATYRYNTENDDSPLRLGLIAEESPPDILALDGKGVDIYKLSTFLLAGVKAQQKEIVDLREKFGTLSLDAIVVDAPTRQTIFDSVISGMKTAVVEAAEFIFDTITTKNVAAKFLQMKDSVTGEIYCVSLSFGEWTNETGPCPSFVQNQESGPPADEAGIMNQDTTTFDITPPTLTIIGNNPAVLHLGDSYSDMGVTITDNFDENLGYKKYLDGALVSQISIDTSTTTTYTIDYVANDNAGNTATTTRTVKIE